MLGNHLFVFFAVLDVSFAVKFCLNHTFFYIYNVKRRAEITGTGGPSEITFNSFTKKV